MDDKYITIGKSTNVLKIKIKTDEGNYTGETLEFNLKDIELLERLDKMWNETHKNKQWIQDQLTIIDKKQDFQPKNSFMSNNEKAKYQALKSFYKKQKELYDLFLGEGGVDKILNGRAFEWETLVEIEKIIDEQIAPYLDITMTNIQKEIREKYKSNDKGNVLKEDE